MPADVLVGRRLTVDALRSAVDAAMAGAGGVVLLAGEAGMGKTALAAEAAAYARARGAIAVWGTSWEGAGAPGYWPWIQVVRALARDGGGGEAVLATLTGANEASGGVLGDEAAVRFRTYDATAAYLRERSAARPLVVVLDDLHWADISSLRLLLFLARQLRDGSALVIGTYRDVEMMLGEHPARGLLAALAGQAGLLQLAGLTASEVGQLLNEVCAEWPPAALAATVHERTGGNPFFVQQTARLLAAQGAPLDRALVTGVPRAVGDVLARRLARLPGEVVDLLAIAAVVGKRFAIAAVAGIAGLPAEDTVPLVDSAVRAGVVEQDLPGGVRFSHDLFREVLYEGLPTARRSTLHLAVAELLERDADVAAPAAQIAYHRMMALPLGDRGRALAAVIEAGREATARMAFDEAAGHLRRAVEVAGGLPAAGLWLLCEYGDALRRTGNKEDARSAFLTTARRARAAGDTAVLARAAFGLHRVATMTESSRADVIALLEEALAVLGPRKADMRWLLTAALARELIDGPDRDRPRAIALGAAAVDGARAAGAQTGEGRRALAYALFALCDVRWEPGTAAERLRIAGELAVAAAAAGETELLLEAHLSRLVALLELGDPAFAAQLDTFSRLAEDAAIPRYLYLARSRRATLASLTGPLGTADELIATAAAYGERIGEPDAWAVQSSQLVGLWAAMAGAGPVTPDELAARSGTVERYVREWLRGVAVAGYVCYDPTGGTFTLSDEMALVIAGQDSPASLIGVFEGFIGLWNDLATIEGFFRTGGGMGWGDHHPALNDAQARFTRPMYRESLVDGWIAALDGVTGRLQAGGRVADIGCGQGTSTILMAERFPASAFTGFDHSDALIATARKAAADAGVSDWASFEVADAVSFPAGPGYGCDLVTFTDCLHDLGDPVAAAAHARSVLAPGGTTMIVEPLAADRFEDDFSNPCARIGYAISTLVCTPSSLAQPGAVALGAMAGEARLRQVLADAGYTRVRRVAQQAAPFNIVLEARP